MYPTRSGKPKDAQDSTRVHIIPGVFFLTFCQSFDSSFKVNHLMAIATKMAVKSMIITSNSIANIVWYQIHLVLYAFSTDRSAGSGSSYIPLSGCPHSVDIKFLIILLISSVYVFLLHLLSCCQLV